MIALAVAGWALVVWTACDPHLFSWLIGPGSILETLLPGTQHYLGVEGIEGVWFLGTLPVFLLVLREVRR